MAQAPTHLLLSLPDDKIIEKLREMNLEEILKFSLVSVQSKDLVKSIKIKADSISVNIASDIAVSIKIGSKSMKLTYYREPDMYWGLGAYGRKKKLTAPQSTLVEVRNPDDHSEDTTSEWKDMDFTMNDWLKHLQDIFSYPKTDVIWFKENSSEFDVDDIKEAFGNATEFHIQKTGCIIFSQMILLKLFPIDQLSIATENFRDSKIPPSLLMQNHTYLSIYKTDENVVPITLDELLLINSKDIGVGFLQFEPKQFNNFVKLWQQGSNPCMEHLRIKYYNIEEDDVMKGIKHEVFPINRRRLFQSTGLAEPYEIDGGFDFYSMNGVKATIEFNWDWYSFYFDMFVWFDHCVVES